MGYFINQHGDYYEGDKAYFTDVEVERRPSQYCDYSDGWVLNLPRTRAAKLAEVNQAFESATSLLTAGYPESEKDSWPNQTIEALAWGNDNAAPTPYLDALAENRGIEPLLYRQKTLDKVIAYKAASAVLIGRRQRYADLISAAEGASDLDAIVPDFTLPA